ncbi:hypothetical protein BSPWISOXPB_3464 [uncultured Gammaproteobacteria bacterium]|nr:hypothetical protein BSPWISOXPB_3464 [uncultured Gammaproteobacteria bacterium]
MLICPLFVLSVLTALFALAWRFEPTMVVVLFGVLRLVLAMVGVIARVVIKVKLIVKMGLAFGCFNEFWWFFV